MTTRYHWKEAERHTTLSSPLDCSMAQLLPLDWLIYGCAQQSSSLLSYN